jgi:rhomboid protease GluP
MLSPRLRWKLNRARDRLLGVWQALFRRQPKPRVCFSCGRLVGASETKCSHCGASQQALSLSVFKRIALAVIPAEYPVTYSLLFANLLFFAVAWVVTLQRTGATGLFARMDNEVMLMLGAKWGFNIVVLKQYWRLVMPNFLHFDLFHFGFNSFVLWQVGPQVEELFGSRRYLFMYLLTGIIGFTVSLWWYDLHGRAVLSAGASASLFGLIGILISYISQRRGFTSEYRASLIRWAIFIIVIGFVLPFDNAAHIGGLLSGMALGRLVDVRRPVSAAARFRVEAMAWGSVLVIFWSVVMVLLNLPTASS